jgi:hypothetical protein
MLGVSFKTMRSIKIEKIYDLEVIFGQFIDMLNIYFPQLANIHIVVQIRGGMVFFITGG